MNLNLNQLRSLMGSKNIGNLYNLLLHKDFLDKIKSHPNPINRESKFYGFSQNEEDGITLEILRRIELQKGCFVEFGAGDGLENNSIILLASDWNGAWFGGQDLAFNVSESNKLSFEKVWITKENILSLYSGLNKDADLISLDLDGNDIYLAETLLSNNVLPKVFIVEYNGKFPPPIDFKIKYNPNHTWDGGDYFGASLAAFNSLFAEYGYRLVCCNISGVNAFFVRNEFAEKFEDVPTDLATLYSEPFYFLRTHKMHPTSPKTLEKLIETSE